MMVAPTGGSGDPDLWIGDVLDERFEEVFTATGLDPGDARERLEALNRAPQPRAFAVLSVDGAPAAIGAGAVEAQWCGLFAMRTSPGFRRRGLAARVLGGLLAWGAERGARRAWLQVEEDNPGAVALYRRAGFSESYRYRYWLKTDQLANTGAPPA
jgi:ribosomal protein S18 acetylase RimI-like enzyme